MASDSTLTSSELRIIDDNGSIYIGPNPYGGGITVSYDNNSYSTAKIHVNNDGSGPLANYIGFTYYKGPKLCPSELIIPEDADNGWRVSCATNGTLNFVFEEDW